MPNQPTILPESNQRILELLHTYRYLNARQLLRLGVATQESYLRCVLKRFDTRPSCIGIAKLGVLPGKGRHSYVYYLTRHGAEVLANHLQVDAAEIDYPTGKVFSSTDEPHRIATVDFQIEWDCFLQRSGFSGEFFHRYFDPGGAHRHTAPEQRWHRRTTLPLGNSSFIPDAVFAVRMPDGRRSRFVLEVFCGSDTERAHRKLEQHRLALQEGRVSESDPHQPFAHRVLGVFEDDDALAAAKERLLADPAFTPALRRQFAFATLAGLQADLRHNWHFLRPGQTDLFALEPAPRRTGGRSLVSRCCRLISRGAWCP